MTVDKDFYNEASAAKLGWEPSWFIPEYTLFDRKLQNAIRAFQREHRLSADGMCGPTTYRRLVAKMEAEQAKTKKKKSSKKRDENGKFVKADEE